MSHARRYFSLNWGVLVCACGAVGHEEIHGNLLAWHRRHKLEAMNLVAVPASVHRAMHRNPVYPFDHPED